LEVNVVAIFLVAKLVINNLLQFQVSLLTPTAPSLLWKTSGLALNAICLVSCLVPDG